MKILLDELTEGAVLPELTRIITQENIDSYASASGDFNPIHIDPEFARKSGLDSTVAHGMLVLAYVSGYMTDLFGFEWLTGGSLNVRFKEPARPGDSVIIKGNIKKLAKNESVVLVSCDIVCTNTKGEPVITGEAKVTIPVK
jgi:3-hydroxybutyryl-CoA dehydratase